QTESLGDGCHGVGGVHAAACSLTRCERALDALEILLAHASGATRADTLERVDDGDLLLGAVRELDPTGCDRSGVEEDAGQAQSGTGHEHSGDRLVASGQQHAAVEPL